LRLKFSRNEKVILTLRRKKEFKELQEFKNGSQEAQTGRADFPHPAFGQGFI
jgi:hypothetical protein